jgi:hypothetical protein
MAFNFSLLDKFSSRSLQPYKLQWILDQYTELLITGAIWRAKTFCLRKHFYKPK